MLIELEVEMNLEQALHRLQSAISAPSRPWVAQRLKPYLGGEVSADEVVLFRRRGLSTWYGTFRGRLHSDGSKVRLTGRFTRSSGVFVSLLAGLAILWGVALAVAVVVRWQGSDSVAWLVAAAVAVSAGTATYWLRAKNARAEAALLRTDIAAILGKHGA
jgi:hypothetical protein